LEKDEEINMKTYSAKPSDINREWYVIDAEDQILGRVATEVARILRGKHKPQFTPHMDTGDFVIVVNADKIKVTGKKLEQKIYYRHSGYLGGLKEESLEKVLATKPTKAIERAVKGMLPHNKLGRALFGKLKVYAGAEHPHAAQTPKKLELGA
jgi:large subunit ribosomal protein L13